MKHTHIKTLMIEDEPACHRLLQKILDKAAESYEIESALSLSDGIDKAREAAFDVVILDLNLPDSQGINTVIKFHEAVPNLPVVVVSGLGEDATIYDALQNGAQEYLTKDSASLKLLPRTIKHAIERQRVDRALKQSSDRWRALFEHNFDETIVVDQEGVITDINAAKRKSGDRLPKTGDLMFVDYASKHEIGMRQELMDCIHTGKTREYPERKYGDKVLSIRISPFPDKNPIGAIITSQNITKRRKAEEALIHERDMAQEYLDIVDVILVAINAKGRVTLINRKGCEILGYPEQEILGENWFDNFLPQSIIETLKTVSKQIVAGDIGPVRYYENPVITKSGKELIIEWSSVELRNRKGIITGHLSAGTDVTEQRKAEAQRLDMEAQLRHSQKLKSIGVLAGGVAHEINNPINGIMNYAQLISESIPKESPAFEYATEISNETKRVAKIVRNLLDFARPSKDEHSPARMCDILEGTLSLVRSVFLRDQVEIEVDLPENLPQLHCRSQQIQQVLMNLITNARESLNEKYPEYDPHKTILITAKEIKKDGKTFVRTTVKDHGIGIADELQEYLFDPFYTSKRQNQGMGLGLSISHTIVKEHGGDLTVESKVNEYAQFHLDLPVLRPKSKV